MKRSLKGEKHNPSGIPGDSAKMANAAFDDEPELHYGLGGVDCCKLSFIGTSNKFSIFD